ncbi:MAG TPA: hypothetical protein ENH41_05570 [Candidatus Omnitrophica bacterium]|nr:hypothetical protein [Candidatus Omnitrophota bacterium]
MDKKSKMIIIALGVISLILGLIAFSSMFSYNSEKAKHKETVTKFDTEKETLVTQISHAKAETKSIRKKLETIQRELNTAASLSDDWKNKYEIALREKEGLIDKITQLQKAKKTKSAAAIKESSSTSAITDDSYWASVLRDRAKLEIEVTGLQERLSDIGIRLEEISKDKNQVDVELKIIKQTNADLERELTYNKKLSQTLSEELVREKNDKKAFVIQLSKIREDYLIIQEQLRFITDEKVLLSKRVKNLKEEKDLLSRKIIEMDQTLESRMDEIIKIKDNLTAIRSTATSSFPGAGSKVVELPAIVVRADSRGTSRRGLSGEVLAVNRENNFVVMDIGESSGVKTGMVFDVYREGRQLGSIDVIQTRRDVSAADIKYLKPGQQIKIGDAIR